MDRDLKQVLTVFAVIASFGGGYFLCRAENKDKIEYGEKFEVFRNIDDIRNEYNCEEVADIEKAIESCVNAYYDYSGDNYFSYYSSIKEQGEIEKVNSSNMLTDNGFQIAKSSDGNILVSSLEPDSYAESQGLQSEDVIIAIDGKFVSNEGFENVVSDILGKNGTHTELLVSRNGQVFSLTYVREFTKPEPTERYEMIGDICYIKYTDSCKATNFGIFSEAADECGEKASAYIVDLRNNGGGETYVAKNILDYFLDEHEICHQYSYNGEENVLKTADGGTMLDKNLVVLMNGKTASSAEIIAAALKQYYGCVTLIGENTYGKGIYQNVKYLEDDGAVYMTIGYYTVGDWDCYQGIGIAPDIEVAMDSELVGTDEDAQLQTAIDYLNGEQID